MTAKTIQARTMFDIAGASLPTGGAQDAALIVIDAQEEYRTGRLQLAGLDDALGNIAAVLAHWRDQGGTVIHVRHHGTGLFDPSGAFAAFIEDVAPVGNEQVVTKSVPNAFGGTNLEDLLTAAACKHVVLAGFMTHVCISTTARAARQKGFAVTILADATATRDLPDALGGDTIPAATLHRAELTILADCFAKVVATKDVIRQ